MRDTIHLADFFIRNDGENDDLLKDSTSRYLDILFNIGGQTPSMDERAMYSAASAAAGSACLSRQVGASIYSEGGELIGVGSNDVPKSGGGLYSIEDGANDHRCYKWGGKICHNDSHKELLYQSIDRELRAGGIITPPNSYANIKKALKRTEVKDLIRIFTGCACRNGSDHFGRPR